MGQPNYPRGGGSYCNRIDLDLDGRRFALVSEHPRSIYLSLAGPLSATGMSLTAAQALLIAESLCNAVDAQRTEVGSDGRANKDSYQ